MLPLLRVKYTATANSLLSPWSFVKFLTSKFSLEYGLDALIVLQKLQPIIRIHALSDPQHQFIGDVRSLISADTHLPYLSGQKF